MHAAPGADPGQDHICLGVPATPVLDWDSVPGAGLYMVYLGNDRELTNRLYTVEAPPTPDGHRQPLMAIEALADNQSGESYYWYIRPCKTPTVCGPDPISTDGRRRTPSRRSHRASSSRTRPRTRSTNASTPRTALKCADDIAFAWKDYDDTNQAVSVRWRRPPVAPDGDEVPHRDLPASRLRNAPPLPRGRPADVHPVHRDASRGRPLVARAGHRRRQQQARLEHAGRWRRSRVGWS